jgi:hypothetical protein
MAIFLTISKTLLKSSPAQTRQAPALMRLSQTGIGSVGTVEPELAQYPRHREAMSTYFLIQRVRPILAPAPCDHGGSICQCSLKRCDLVQEPARRFKQCQLIVPELEGAHERAPEAPAAKQ